MKNQLVTYILMGAGAYWIYQKYMQSQTQAQSNALQASQTAYQAQAAASSNPSAYVLQGFGLG